MNVTEIEIEEQKVSNLNSFVNYVKTQRNFVDKMYEAGLFEHIQFSANSKSEKNVGGISGWKNYDFAVIEVLWVTKENQNKKIGSRIVESFTTKCKELGCSTVLTTVNSHLEGKSFWEKCGFVQFAEIDTQKTKITYLKKQI